MDIKQFHKTYEKFLKDFKLKSEEVVIGAGAALMLLGLREVIGDIDAAVPIEIFNQLAKKHKETIYEVKETTGIRKARVIPDIMPDIDLHIEEDIEDTFYVEGIRIYTPKRLLKQKKLMNREKDQKDIAALEKLIKNKQSKKLINAW